jgi:hypothetical protein
VRKPALDAIEAEGRLKKVLFTIVMDSIHQILLRNIEAGSSIRPQRQGFSKTGD